MLQFDGTGMHVFAWVRDNLLATFVCFLLVATVTGLSTVGVAAWSVAALATGGSSGVVFDLLLLLLLGGVVVGTALSVASLVGLAYGLVARAGAALSEAGTRLARRVDDLERRNVFARTVGLSDLTASVDGRSRVDRAQERLDCVKARYVEGDLSESEFERRLGEVLGEEWPGRGRPSTHTDRGRDGVREYDR